MIKLKISFEQAVYGSFPFWDRGYAVLARSPGCRPGWLEALRRACQRYGERPRGVADAPALFALRAEGGPWMVVGVAGQGADDRGRPGALAFHALFLDARAARRLGHDPFALVGALRGDWGPEVTSLPAGTWEVEPDEAPVRPADERARRIAAALARGRRVAIESPAPIDALARDVWRALPGRVRRRASVATWAFANGNRFDLVALPRLAGVAFDASYTSLEELEAEPAPTSRTGWRPGRVALGGAAAASGALIGLLTLGHGPGSAHPLPAPAPAVAVGPDPSAYRDQVDEPGDRALVAEALLDLAARFEVPVDDLARDDPPALMARIADRLRYRGPLLTPADRGRLAAEADPDRDRALAWEGRVRRFVADRPLPADFARGPLRWQLETLAWSFHLEGDPRLSAAEVPRHLADALSVDVATRPSPLEGRYPALGAYAAFLGRLPRR